MKITRNKKAARVLAVYKKHYGFFAPFNILLDGTFCQTALQNKMKISEQLPNYINEELKIVTTQCCILELENLTKISKALNGAYLILKQFPTHRCGHEGKPVASSACIKSLLGTNNPYRYIVASDDKELKDYIRDNWYNVPQLCINRSAPTLEKVPKRTMKVLQESSQVLITNNEVEKLDAMQLALGLKKQKKKSGKQRKRLTGAEQKRRKRQKQEKILEERKERDRQLSKDQLQTAQNVKPRKKSSKSVDIHDQIRSLFST